MVCSSVAHAAPVTLRDALGRNVVLEQPPQRIVAIFSSNVELLDSLGLMERIVGVEDMTRYPPGAENIASVGGRLGFSAEAIARLDPDLVVITPARQAAHTLVRPLERIGVPVLVLTHATIDEVLSNLTLLGAATGTQARAAQVRATLEARLARVGACLAGAPRPRVFMETGRVGASGAISTPRPASYTADALARAGGALAFRELRATPQVSPEALFGADPDWILIAGAKSVVDMAAARPGWAHLRAVREGRIAHVERGLFLIPGPRVVDGIEHLAATLHPDRPCARTLVASAS
jgi:iron complex transport system substrate-binding protein